MVLDEVSKGLLNLDKKDNVTKQELDQVPKLLTAICHAQSGKVKTTIEDRIQSYIKTNDIAKMMYKHYQVNCVFKVVTNVLAIGGGAAVTGLTFGAASPASIVAIARGCGKLAQESCHMCMGVKTLIKEINVYLKAYESLSEALKTGNEDLRKHIGTAQEVTLSVIAGIIGVDLPTAAAISKLLQELVSKTQGIISKRVEYGEQISLLQKEIDRYNEGAGDLDAETRKKQDKKVTRITNEMEKMMSKVNDMFDLIKVVAKNHRELEERLEECKSSKNLEKWGELSGKIASAGTSLLLTVTTGEGDPEHIVEIVNTCVEIFKDEVEDKKT